MSRLLFFQQATGNKVSSKRSQYAFHDKLLSLKCWHSRSIQTLTKALYGCADPLWSIYHNQAWTQSQSHSPDEVEVSYLLPVVVTWLTINRLSYFSFAQPGRHNWLDCSKIDWRETTKQCSWALGWPLTTRHHQESLLRIAINRGLE